MSKKNKKTDKKAKLAKLKKVVKKLKRFEDKLKGKEKKIAKKLGKAGKLKKGKLAVLKEKLDKSARKMEKVAKDLAEKKQEMKKMKGSGEEMNPTKKKTVRAKQKDNQPSLAQVIAPENTQNNSKIRESKKRGPASELAIPNSLDFNSKNAIAYLRKLPTIIEIESFIKKDARITVKKAAGSRMNAIKKVK